MTGKNKKKQYLIKFLLVMGSLLSSLLLAEGISRIFLDPIDYLKPKTVSDEILGLRIEPYSGAHDSWGFRNKKVPKAVDIVAIGDSHTYGISAKSSYSWPSILQRLTRKNVYNLSLGGYGPVEYYYLLKNKAFKLNPNLVIVGLYLGNDISNAYRSVYGNNYWRSLRRTDFIPEENIKPSKVDRQKFSHKLEQWLPGNSVLYRLISSSAIGDELRNLREIYRGEEVVMFRDKEHNIKTGFTPTSKLRALNLTLPDVQEGLRITLDLINQMNILCTERNIDFLVLLIPTKESVYSDFIQYDSSLPKSQTINELLRNERLIDKTIRTFLENKDIPYVDVLGPLSDAARSIQLYPNNFGGHTNRNGYEIIAKSIHRYLLETSTD
jgi:hypothetical protein